MLLEIQVFTVKFRTWLDFQYIISYPPLILQLLHVLIYIYFKYWYHADQISNNPPCFFPFQHWNLSHSFI